MRHVWLTARHEVRTTLGRRAFWLTTLLIPVAVVLLVVVPQAVGGGSDDPTAFFTGGSSETSTIGYVDPAGLLQTAPAGLPPDLVRAYRTEDEAKAALAAGAIDRYCLVAEDYLASGRLTVVQQRYQPLRALDGRELITYVINTGIIGDETLARLLLDPTPGGESRSLDPAGAPSESDPGTAYFLPYLLMFVLYMALAMTSGFMLQSVSREKENRTAEVLLVTLKPRDLMLGKIAGLSTVGLLQVVIWLAVIFGVLLSGGKIAGMEFEVGGGFVARVIPWTIVYFLLGYLMYASVYAVFGVLAPSARDANQFVFIAIVPLVVPLLFLTTFAETPEGTLATTLSLFPLTSPVAMVARLGAESVPWWQLLLGAVALAAFAYLFVLLAARLFRADNLLSVRALTWARLRSEMRLRPAAAGPGGHATEAPVGAPERPGAAPWRGASAEPDKTGPRFSKQRVAILVAVAVVMLYMGIREYARGDSTGLFIAVAGVIIAAAAYWRWRKGR